MQHIAQAHAEWLESLTPEQRAKYDAAHEAPTLTTEVTVKVFLTITHDGSDTEEDIRDEAIRDVEQSLLGAPDSVAFQASSNVTSTRRPGYYILDTVEGALE